MGSPSFGLRSPSKGNHQSPDCTGIQTNSTQTIPKSHAQPVHDFFLSRAGKNCPHPVDKQGQKKRKLEKMTIFCCVTGNYHNITKQNA